MSHPTREPRTSAGRALLASSWALGPGQSAMLDQILLIEDEARFLPPDTGGAAASSAAAPAISGGLDGLEARDGSRTRSPRPDDNTPVCTCEYLPGWGVDTVGCPMHGKTPRTA